MLGRMRWPLAPVTTACLGKARWGSEKTAQRALTRLKGENPGAFDSTVRPYRCPFCRAFHVGHGR